ncbi:MAG: alpha/beta fold hydrolase [Acidimicrobiales bacterium]
MSASSGVADVETRRVRVWDGRIDLRVQVRGQGEPLLYLHPAGGLTWDPFLEDLARDHTVYAPEFPGTSAGDANAVHELDDVFDVVLAYEEAVRALGLAGATVVGQSFGGMLAAELASCFPALFGRVVLLDPAGLWVPEHPYGLGDIMAGPPQNIPTLLFHDPSCAGARAMFAPPADPAAALDGAVALVWAIGCTAKFLWPIPDRGLHKRLHRLSAPTLIVWGEQDALVPVAYAHEFQRRIGDARVVLVPQCGHIPQVEQPEATIAAVREFLGS